MIVSDVLCHKNGESRKTVFFCPKLTADEGTVRISKGLLAQGGFFWQRLQIGHRVSKQFCSTKIQKSIVVRTLYIAHAIFIPRFLRRTLLNCTLFASHAFCIAHVLHRKHFASHVVRIASVSHRTHFASHAFRTARFLHRTRFTLHAFQNFWFSVWLVWLFVRKTCLVTL